MKFRIATALPVLFVVTTAYGAVPTNLLTDPGFENISGNEPDIGSSPWATAGENENGSYVTGTDRFLNGAKSAKFTFYFDNGSIIQNLTNRIDSAQDYTASIWMLADEQSADANFNNPPELAIELYSSPTLGSGYTRAGTFSAGNLNSADDNWELFSGTVPASVLTSRDGEYIQIRFTKENPNSSHRMWIDDASLTTSIPVPNTFYVDTVSGNDTNDGVGTATASQGNLFA